MIRPVWCTAWLPRKRESIENLAERESAGTVENNHVDQHEACPRARSARRAHLLLPRGVLVDVLREFAGQLTPTGATLPPASSTLALLCQVIEHEALGIGMIVKGMKLRASLNLHHAYIPYARLAVGADQLFSLHAAHLLSTPSAAMTHGPCASPSRPFLRNVAGSVPGSCAGARRA